jgi:CO/xanthine dehydrogenase FAD-binding subunit
MRFYKPESMSELLDNLQDKSGKKYFLAGGTDINVQIKNGLIRDAEIFYINHLNELKIIEETAANDISIGATATFLEILNSALIKKYLPFLQSSLEDFASPILQTSATIGGNIANGSPTADVIPLLLVLDARLELKSKAEIRMVPISEFFYGYKQSILNFDELISKILISKTAEKGYLSFYEKVGARQALTIAKIALAGLKKVESGTISEIKLAVGSLNEYPRRLSQIEKYLLTESHTQINRNKIEELLNREITPITDLRSDKEYRFQVCANLICTFLQQ